VGHHSTSDDSLAYRTKDEIDKWVLENNPITRFKNFLTKASVWNEKLDKEFRVTKRSEVLTAFINAEKEKKPSVDNMFTDVYSEMPWNLKEQLIELLALLDQFPNEYPLSDYKQQ
jgi:2-oxoisovalerate dehydrogenase E1 component alpha subunit